MRAQYTHTHKKEKNEKIIHFAVISTLSLSSFRYSSARLEFLERLRDNDGEKLRRSPRFFSRTADNDC